MWKNVLRMRRCIVALLILSFFLGTFLGIALISNVDFMQNRVFAADGGSASGGNFVNHRPPKDFSLLRKLKPKKNQHSNDIVGKHMESNLKVKQNGNAGNANWHLEGQVQDPVPVKVMPNEVVLDSPEKVQDFVPAVDETYTEPNYDVHVFYYPWYGNPKFDGAYLHWNHEYLPHWNKEEGSKWPTGKHVPPDDIGSSFYPSLGPYSSRDPAVISDHMRQIRSTGVGVLSVSWYPPGDSDEQGHTWDNLMLTILDAAHKHKLKICFHIEPYKDRTHVSMRRNLEYITRQYGGHPALYRRSVSPQAPALPLYYIYDSYLVSAPDWAQLFQPDGALTVRGTDMDGIFVGLIVEAKSKSDLVSAGFDGIYTYFASDGFTYGSNTRSWISLAAFARNNNLLFIPSVGPGYIDVTVRPWNKQNTKQRQGGKYYEDSFKAALAAKPPLISITSFNEWHEGTQIETAVPKQYKDFRYLDYTPGNPDHYLQLTRKWVEKFRNMDRLLL